MMMQKPLGVLLLEPIQSVTLHGWLSPKRTLVWEDVVRNDRITVERMVVDARIPQEDLRRLQPDIREWIEKKYVSYEVIFSSIARMRACFYSSIILTPPQKKTRTSPT
jgi:hypothetical protein